MSAGIKAPKKLIEVALPLDDGGGSDLDIRSKNSFLSKLLRAEISRLGAPPRGGSLGSKTREMLQHHNVAAS